MTSILHHAKIINAKIQNNAFTQTALVLALNEKEQQEVALDKIELPAKFKKKFELI